VDEALSEFVVRRLGVEVLDYLIDPFVGGVYAGDPGRLSVEHAFPKLHKLEQTYGSLIKGSLVGARARKKRERAEGTVSKTSARMLSFEGGLSVLVDRLRAKLGNAVELGTAVKAMRPNGWGWTLELATGHIREGTIREHSAVLLCAPAHRVAQMKILGVAAAEMESLRTVYYPPIARVAVAFPRDKIAHALDGIWSADSEA